MVQTDNEILFIIRKKRSSYEKTWRKLTCMLLSERRKSEKATYHMIPTIRHSEKGKTMETVKKVVARGWKVKRGMNWRDELADLGSSENSLYDTIMMGSVQFSHSFVSLRPHGWQHARLPCPLPTPRAFSDSCPLSQ